MNDKSKGAKVEIDGRRFVGVAIAARTAYEAYCDHRVTEPGWDDLSEEQREMWANVTRILIREVAKQLTELGVIKNPKMI